LIHCCILLDFSLWIIWFTFTIKLHLKSYLVWWFWNILSHNSFLTCTAGTWRTCSCQEYSMNIDFSLSIAILDSVLSHILSPHNKFTSYFLVRKIVASTIYITLNLSWIEGRLCFIPIFCVVCKLIAYSIIKGYTGWHLYTQAI
jgi:hypothetical protein